MTPIALGFVGGAAPAMIGPVHQRAALLDRRFAVVAGAFSSNPDKAAAAAREYGVAPDRSYPSAEAMFAAEKQLPDGIAAVTIVTPNDSHRRLACAAAEAGLHVMLEKPLANTMEEATAIAEAVAAHGTILCLAHAYSGYPMIREARAQVEAGALGALRMVQVEYFGAGLASFVEAQVDAPRRWRLDPATSGPSLVLGDIGTHAFHLACYVTGQSAVRLSAELGTLQPGRVVQDYANLRFRLEGGARGSLIASQAAAGAENHILLRVWGEQGHLEWRHDRHGELRLASRDGFPAILTRQHPLLSATALAAGRQRRGHPEGLHEAFANLYQDFAELILARQRGSEPAAQALSVPGLRDGLAGMRMIAAALESQFHHGAWVDLPPGN
ncbi:Gfo/Idh/MocA family protein [Falsiroseomonas sp. HC035]|uniref:Gfo/Idh/MocA family protein n=1 Tax=Falsiroseomonas sp. HC035 TaxID=3390999 RepID=UPI003D313D37